MVFLENLKDQIVERLLGYWDTIQESSLYMQTSERFQALPRSTQIIIISSAAVFLAVFLFLIPYSYYEEADEQFNLYDETASIISSLDKVNRESAGLDSIPRGVSANELSGIVRSVLDRARLQPEQIVAIEAQSVEKSTGKDAKGLPWKSFPSEQVIATLKKLNLRQVVEIGRSVETQSASLVFLNLSLSASADDPHYFDAIYTFASFQLGGDDQGPIRGSSEPTRFKGR